MSKWYEGERLTDGTCVVRVYEGETGRLLDWRLDLASHSPTGLEWGYVGSGPSQLALALLCDALGEDALEQCPLCGFDRPPHSGHACPDPDCGADLKRLAWQRPRSLYNLFLWETVQGLPYKGWTLTQQEVRDAAQRLEADGSSA